MTLMYDCPHCGEECEADVQAIDHIEVWCDACGDITEEFDVYEDYISRMSDEATDYFQDR